MKYETIGILAHVDAGKTTLAEAMLFNSGKIRTMGRVDTKNTSLDFHTLEKSRGITIFSSYAVIETKNTEITLLDTPGHVDFSAEMERTLSVLDYAILVISGIDGVQAHTRTLWKLLEHYNIPTFIFVTKMDFARHSRNELMDNLTSELSDSCVDFSSEPEERNEKLAMCHETILEKYLSGEQITDDDISLLVASRCAFPVFFGSGLKLTNVDSFMDGLDRFTREKRYPDTFGARVFKVTYEGSTKVTHMKITGGRLRVKDSITEEEKVNQIRIYSGLRYETVNEVRAGKICSVTGLGTVENGSGLGYEGNRSEPVLEPVMTYRIVLPEDCDPRIMLPNLKKLEEEDPLMKFTWNSLLQEIDVCLMGKVQTEILKSIVSERFGTDIQIDNGRVIYKETIKNTVEGVGHYEPLRHYAEVHLLMEPLPRNSGIQVVTRCSEDLLDRNWQRLIQLHIKEKEHLGVLTGSPLTDVKIILAAGRAHIKHTEGGDFRQATYRAIRQGLMQAESVLLEPYCTFSLEVPYDQIGRAINDVKMKNGDFSLPEESGEMSVINGRGPMVCFLNYAQQVASYTGGLGHFSIRSDGYDVCHNADEVIKEYAYNPEADLDNTPDSVFCAHGGGFGVKWNDVHNYMHLESCLSSKNQVPVLNYRNFHIDEKELQAIMEREFGKVRYDLYRPSAPVKPRESENVEFTERKQWVIVDGYNVIFAWDSLRDLAKNNLQSARDKLQDILSNYAAFTKAEVVLVFDAYKVPGNRGEKFDYQHIHVAYTRERELGDVYIEKLLSEIGKNDKVKVVSSDGLIQLSAVRFGVLRESAREFEEEMQNVEEKISDIIRDLEEENEKEKRKT